MIWMFIIFLAHLMWLGLQFHIFFEHHSFHFTLMLWIVSQIMSFTNNNDHFIKSKTESRHVIARKLKAEQKRITREMYRKKKMTLIKKTHELEKLCEMNVAIIICRNNHYFIYHSMKRRSWPPFIKQIVSRFFSTSIVKTYFEQKISYSLFENLLSRDLKEKRIKDAKSKIIENANAS